MSTTPAASYRIGDLARQFEIPVETLRYYEREGLLPPPHRSAGNYRLYGEAHRYRLSFIRRCRTLDMPLAEIRQLLKLKVAPQDSEGAVSAMLDAHIRRVESRIHELARLKDQLQDLRDRCSAAGAGVDQEILRDLCAVPEGELAGGVAGAAKRRKAVA